MGCEYDEDVWVFSREHDKKVCILGLASLLAVPSAAMPPELQSGLDQVFRALLKLLVAYKEQREGGDLWSVLVGRSIPCRCGEDGHNTREGSTMLGWSCGLKRCVKGSVLVGRARYDG